MEMTIDQLPCGVVLIDEGGVMKTINTTVEQHLNYAPGELLGQPFGHLLTVASRMLYQTHIYPLLNLHGQIDEVVLTLLTKQGDRIPVLFNAVRRLQDGHWFIQGIYLPLGQRHHYEAELIQARQTAEAAQQALQESEAKYRILATDLEARVLERTKELAAANANLMQLNADLGRSNDNLQQFAFVASHDLQEPLRKIQSFGSLLSERYGPTLGKEGRNLLERMTSAGSRMSSLIRDLLTYSRIVPRQETFGLVSLEAIVAAVLDRLMPEIRQRYAQVLLEKLPLVKGDASQLGQLFTQLLTNALKYTPVDQHPLINVTGLLCERSELPAQLQPTSPASHFYQICVRDEGIGFDTKYLDRIFQVFQRLHSQDQFAGTGVGLAICQRVVENHGGAITATSQLGRGATFYVYLPR